MFKKVAVLACAIALILALSVPALAGDKEDVEAVAQKYVTAFETANWAQAKEASKAEALSWVEYNEAKGTPAAGPITIVSTESSAGTDSYVVKLIYKDGRGELKVRYLKAKKADGTKWSIVDDGRKGRNWVSTAFLPGYFAMPDEIDGLKVFVSAVLQVPEDNMVKFDLVIENTTDQEKRIYPSLEAYYTAETTRTPRRQYDPVPGKSASSLDGPIGPKARKSGYLIFPFFVKDFYAVGDSLEGLKWKIHIPYSVTDQFVIFHQ